MPVSLPSLRVLLALLAVPVLAATVAAQSPRAPLYRANRDEISARVRMLDSALQNPKLKPPAKLALTQEASDLRRRLQDGDFKIGDRFLVLITQDSIRTDTATVFDGLQVTVAAMPPLSVRGVLRSELSGVVNTHLARFLRNVTVRTAPLVRIAVLGGVGQPGFYYYAPDQPLNGVLQLAGGPVALATGKTAKLDELEIYRNGLVVLSKKQSKQALKDGKTIEELDIQSGDELRFAVGGRNIDWRTVTQILFFGTTIFFSVINFLRWYVNRNP